MGVKIWYNSFMGKSSDIKLPPFAFGHIYSSAPWGGEWLRALFNRTDAPEVCSESWEISGHPFGMSVVAGGALAGRTLASLVEEFGTMLVGSAAGEPSRFPLLFKLLDARRSLSVQVHPSSKTAAATGGEPKTEAWVVLAAAPGAALYAGVERGVTEAAFRDAVAQGEALVGLLARHSVKAGDVLYVPGGVVHAIGAGCLVYEVQQSSNSTYRFYDWDRVDAYGRGRPLHLEQAFKALDLTFPPVAVHRACEESVVGGNVWKSLVKSPSFRISELDLVDGLDMTLDGRSFVAVFALEGGVKLETDAGAVEVMRGSSALVPASSGRCRFKARTSATRLLVTTL